MLIGSVVLYLVVTIAIGLWAAKRVHNSKDYVVAGRSLPLYMNAATVFATWFGAETVLSVSAEFAKNGMGSIIADPFGSSFCVVIAISYLGWTAAQLTALGLAFSTLSGGAISLQWGIVLSAVVVLAYTVWGGMWSVALTDLFQSVMIIAGVGIIAWFVGDMAGGAGKVVAAAAEAGKFEFWPRGGSREWLFFFTAWATLALGSIPQQDIFQRVTSAKNERTAILGTLAGGVIYFAFAFVPIFIVFAALMVDPSLGQLLSAEDAREMQSILPAFILRHTPLWVQVLFFGALLSAILSTASGAIIAPTSLVTENVIRPLERHMSDRKFLLTLRVVLVVFTAAALIFALLSKKTMYDMIQNAYSFTLVAAFVPLAAGIFWKRANNAGAIVSALSGFAGWLAVEWFVNDPALPSPLVGLAFSLLGVVAGSLVPRPVRAPAHR